MIELDQPPSPYSDWGAEVGEWGRWSEADQRLVAFKDYGFRHDPDRWRPLWVSFDNGQTWKYTPMRASSALAMGDGIENGAMYEYRNEDDPPPKRYPRSERLMDFDDQELSDDQELFEG